MEYQGIITGIGDLEQHINEITPDIDAKINDFLLSRNAIIEGFSIENGYLNGGILVFKGYRCKYWGEPISLSNSPNYINGIIRTNSNGNVYEFFLEPSSTQGADTEIPTQPNSGACFAIFSKSGTSYFLVDNFKDNRLEDYHYPAKAYESDESRLLMLGGVISENATTPTAAVNAHNTEPNRVANTEYVHNQIQAEINAASYNGEFRNSNNNIIGTYTLERKAKFVIIKTSTIDWWTNSGTLGGIWTTFPNGFLPNTSFYFVVSDASRPNFTRYIRLLSCNTSGEVRQVQAVVDGDNLIFTNTSGYQTN